MYENDGPAILFENVEGYDIPYLVRIWIIEKMKGP